MDPQRSSYRFGTSVESYEDQLHKNGLTALTLAQQQQQQQYRKRQSRGAENMGLSEKFCKVPFRGDAGDCRRNLMPNLKHQQDLSHEHASGFPCAGGGMATLAAAVSKQSWKTTSGRESARRRDSGSDDMENHHTVSAVKREASPRSDSLHSKTSSLSLNEELLSESFSSPFNATMKRSSSVLLHETESVTHSALLGDHIADVNLVMLLGLMLGLFISKALQYLQLYCSWFQSQVLQLRSAFLGHSTFWEFVNFDDNSRYGVRTKLLLLPLVGTCSLLYGVVGLMHGTIGFLLIQAPNSLVTFIEKLYA